MRHSATAGYLLAVASTAVGEGLYGEAPGSAVKSLLTLDAVPSGTDASQPFTLVEYYSTWCGHCQSFAPLYEQVAVQARTRFPSLAVTAVSCVDHEDICVARHVSSYPTLVLYPGEITYKGAHTTQAVLDWVHTLFAGGKAASAASKPVAHDLGPAVANQVHEWGATHPELFAGSAAASTASKPGGHDLGPAVAAAGAASSVGRVQPDQLGHVMDGAQKEAARALNETIGLLGQMGLKRSRGVASAAVGPVAIASASAPLHRATADDSTASSPMPMLRLRQMPAPAPTEDILAAARYSLEHDVAAAHDLPMIPLWSPYDLLMHAGTRSSAT